MLSFVPLEMLGFIAAERIPGLIEQRERVKRNADKYCVVFSGAMLNICQSV